MSPSPTADSIPVLCFGSKRSFGFDDNQGHHCPWQVQLTLLLWLRTKRRLSTYDDGELEQLMQFEARLRHPEHYGPIEVRDPIEGEDQLLYQVETLGRIHDLAVAFASVMDDYFVEDWCITEVGDALGPIPHNLDEIPEGYSFAIPSLGIGGLNWNRYGVPARYQTGATGLWLDLARDLDECQHLLRRVEQALPRPSKRMWAGRRSVLFAYQSDHNPRSRAFYGLDSPVRDVLASEQCETWLAFQIGNWSLGGPMGEMSQMADFIRKLPSRRIA